MCEYAITVIGRDRPGIIAEATGILAGLGLNLTDSTMTRLRGHFAMTLVCSRGDVATTGGDGEPGGADSPGGGVGQIESAMRELTADGSLVVTVRRVGQETEPFPEGGHYILTVHGADRLGIVASLTRAVAEEGGNITDLTTRLTGDLYLLIAEVDLPAGVDALSLDHRLSAVAAAAGLEASLRPAEADLL